MADEQRVEWIAPMKGTRRLPVIEILTGRGFITGKSGSGKSNSASVIAEELLEANYNLLIVDPEGEYYGLKEKYEILHVGNSELSDVQVSPGHADQLAEIALERNLPIILDVSEYLDGEEARTLIANVVRALFQKEKQAKKPFLLMIEEMQEYLPQQGGSDELSKLLERVAKRGRKRGLGMLGMSQRPSSVDKDFITQCDWMVWHRLTWHNDLEVVRNVLGSEKKSMVEDLDTGEGFLMTDWDETVERVQFKRKQTHDAGATPGLESYDRPDLKSVSQDLINEIESNTNSTAAQAGSDVPPELQSADIYKAVQSIERGENRPSDGEFDGDLAELDESEIQARIEALQYRNQAISERVAELQTVISDDGTGATPNHEHVADSYPSVGSFDEEPEPRNEIPPKPAPPSPPVDRTGAAGNLIEFVAMLVFLLQSLFYRCRLLWYRIRWGNRGSNTT